MAEAVSLDPNPGLAALLSVAAFRGRGEAQPPDYALMRLSLRYALAAAEARPFSADVLSISPGRLCGGWSGRLDNP